MKFGLKSDTKHEVKITYRFDGRVFTYAQWSALHKPQKERFLWRYDDGGRAATGRKGHAGDCVCRAIAIATGQPYEQIYRLLDAHCRPHRKSPNARKPSARFGVPLEVWEPLLVEEGWRYQELPRNEQFNARHLPIEGCTIVHTNTHLCTVKYGVIYDTYDSSYKGTAWVKGYCRRY